MKASAAAEAEAIASQWQSALFLEERVALRGRHGRPANPTPERLDQARRTLALWKAALLNSEEHFSARLASVDLDEESLLALLAEPPPAETGEPAPWQDFLDALFEEGSDQHLPLPAILSEKGPEEAPDTPFLGLLRPILQEARARLRRRTAETEQKHGLQEPLLSLQVEMRMLDALGQRLFTLAGPTLVLELNVARLEGRLSGECPQERLRSYSEDLLAQPGFRRSLFGEYMVLARLLATAVDFWVEAMSELAEHWAEDGEAIAGTFLGSGRTPGALHDLRLSLSDPHRRGRGVLIVELESGLKLVYKPRPVEIDRRFQDLLAWIEGLGLGCPHRRIGILDRGSHGWFEYVEAEPCLDQAQVERFFWRQGSLLALLYSLRAVDFHYENLIAAGEHPVLIDLESLLHGQFDGQPPATALGRAQKSIAESVFGVGLLPIRIWGKDGKDDVEMGGLGGTGERVFPNAMPVLVHLSTDAMRIEPRKVSLPKGKNRPVLEGHEVDSTNFVEAIASGFRDTYVLLTRYRAELAEQLSGWAGTEVRFIPRPTMRYALFLREGQHPDYLRDSLDRDRMLDRLWAEGEVQPALERLIPSEQADLRFGDIPIFTGRPGCLDLWDSRGARIEGFFRRTSLDLAYERIAQLGPEDCARQVDLIYKSMVVLDSGTHASASGPTENRSAQRPVPGSEELLETAVAIGERLRAQAIGGEEDVTWIATSLRAELNWRWVLAPLETSLYDGLAGMALFFGYLAAITERADFADLARRAMRPVVERAALAGQTGGPGVGVFSGLAGYLYVSHHLAALGIEATAEGSILAAASTGLAAPIRTDSMLDLLGGVSGCSIVLLDLHRRIGDPWLHEAALGCGERLLETAQEMVPRGLGWVGATASEALSGFSHGAGGIAWALLRLSRATSEERFREAALAALAFERTLFLPEAGNWMDRRHFEQAPEDHNPIAWCHGASGVALSRLLALPYLDTPEIRQEIHIGIETVLKQGFGGSHCLCHGDLGNLDILLYAAETLNEERWWEAGQEQLSRVHDQLRSGEIRCGLPRFIESPGLMTGLAGIGYGLLRLAFPARVPSVLRLAPPVAPPP